MTYIENVFICMASPLLIAALCMGKRQTKFFLFCLAGMGRVFFPLISIPFSLHFMVRIPLPPLRRSPRWWRKS